MRSSLAWIVAAALAIGAALALWAPWRMPSLPFRQSAIAPGAETTTDEDALNYGPSAVLSSDGSRLAFLGRDNKICVRQLNEAKAACLDGTSGARDPFFSPDGQSIAFFTAKQLQKVPVAGGAVVPLASVEQDRGGAWTESGAIYFSTFRGPVQRIATTGGRAILGPSPRRAGRFRFGRGTAHRYCFAPSTAGSWRPHGRSTKGASKPGRPQPGPRASRWIWVKCAASTCIRMAGGWRCELRRRTAR